MASMYSSPIDQTHPINDCRTQNKNQDRFEVFLIEERRKRKEFLAEKFTRKKKKKKAKTRRIVSVECAGSVFLPQAVFLQEVRSVFQHLLPSDLT